MEIGNGDLSYSTTFPSLVGQPIHDPSGSDLRTSSTSWVDIDLSPHVVIIHRTKLQELLKGQDATNTIVDNLFKNVGQVIVTTGSGSTHGIEGEFKILPFSTLNELILGKRIQKLRLTKLLLELNKDNTDRNEQNTLSYHSVR